MAQPSHTAQQQGVPAQTSTWPTSQQQMPLPASNQPITASGGNPRQSMPTEGGATGFAR